MKDMFDPMFDPLTELRHTQSELANVKMELFQLQGNFHKLVQAHNAQSSLVKQIADQNTQLLQMMTFNQTFKEKHL